MSGFPRTRKNRRDLILLLLPFAVAFIGIVTAETILRTQPVPPQPTATRCPVA